MTYTEIIAAVRGLVVDRVEAGIANAFLDTEIVVAINLAKNDFFGRRPEAFSIATVVTEPPADIGIGDVGDEVPVSGWAMMTFCYGIATFLLRQRGKDSYYRKAADAMNKAYLVG